MANGDYIIGVNNFIRRWKFLWMLLQLLTFIGGMYFLFGVDAYKEILHSISVVAEKSQLEKQDINLHYAVGMVIFVLYIVSYCIGMLIEAFAPASFVENALKIVQFCTSAGFPALAIKLGDIFKDVNSFYAFAFFSFSAVFALMASNLETDFGVTDVFVAVGVAALVEKPGRWWKTFLLAISACGLKTALVLIRNFGNARNAKEALEEACLVAATKKKKELSKLRRMKRELEKERVRLKRERERVVMREKKREIERRREREERAMDREEREKEREERAKEREERRMEREEREKERKEWEKERKVCEKERESVGEVGEAERETERMKEEGETERGEGIETSVADRVQTSVEQVCVRLSLSAVSTQVLQREIVGEVGEAERETESVKEEGKTEREMESVKGERETERGEGIETSVAERVQTSVEQGSPEDDNSLDFTTELKSGKFFIVKSFGEENIISRIKDNVWSITPPFNETLDSAYHEAKKEATVCPVLLFLSVDDKRKFLGVAEMVGPVDIENGMFPVKLLIVKDVPYNQFDHILVENMPVTLNRDSQEVKFEQGIKMLHIFKNYVCDIDRD